MSELQVIEAEVKAAVVKVETVAEAVVAKVEEKVKAAIVEIKAEEQLVLRNAELEFLKSQMEIQRLSKIAEAKSKEYTTYVEQLFVKYGVTKAEYVFDGTVNAFKKL
jgi:hypothetical protein